MNLISLIKLFFKMDFSFIVNLVVKQNYRKMILLGEGTMDLVGKYVIKVVFVNRLI